MTKGTSKHFKRRYDLWIFFSDSEVEKILLLKFTDIVAVKANNSYCYIF